MDDNKYRGFIMSERSKIGARFYGPDGNVTQVTGSLTRNIRTGEIGQNALRGMPDFTKIKALPPHES